ncbi:MAG: hypothetical protein KF916_04880 [Microbacteriaceae bacterium]|nr:hypothetical protein [Microbacteriaceae bacterium]
MRYFSPADVPSGLQTVVTLGKFDAVHIGHQALLRQVRDAAKAAGLQSAAVIMDRNPLLILRPELEVKPDLITNDRKSELIDQIGIDIQLQLEVTKELLSMEPEDFVKEIYVETLGAKYVVASENSRFGKRARGDINLLREIGPELGFEVIPDELVYVDGQRASSSTVRNLIDSEDFEAAERMLGRSLAEL